MTSPLPNLLIFTRTPTPGAVKTRLIPALGPEGAARLQEMMTARVLDEARSLNWPMEIWMDGPSRLEPERAQNSFHVFPQPHGDLGERMLHALERSLAYLPGGAILVGSDIPHLTKEILDQARERLERNDLVLGPANDGGYYLIGMKETHASLFSGIEWGGADVLSATMGKAWEIGLKSCCLETLGDMDCPADLSQLAHWLPAQTGKISIIIPTYNEEHLLPKTLRHLRAICDSEIIVSDGGSSDATCRIASDCGARVLKTTGRGRSRQLNYGALEALGEYLLFLHADTLLPDGFEGLVRSTLEDPGVALGAFSLRFDVSTAGLRLVERLGNWRSRTFKIPYGDQAMFLRKSDFWGLAGGFSDMPIMEDYDLGRRLRRKGRVATLEARVVTSARRWTRLGTFRTLLINQLFVLAWKWGVSADRLAGYYRRLK